MPLKPFNERTAQTRAAEGDDFERVEKGNYDDSFHALVRPYLKPATNLHRNLDTVGVGPVYRNAKHTLPYFGLKGDLGHIGLDVIESGIEYFVFNE